MGRKIPEEIMLRINDYQTIYFSGEVEPGIIWS